MRKEALLLCNAVGYIYEKSALVLAAMFCFSLFGGGETAAYALGSKPPKVEEAELSGTRVYDGTLLLDYDLNTNRGTKPMAWDDRYTSFTYNEDGYYSFSKISGTNSYFFSPTTGEGKVFDVKPNRNYLVSALVYCDFDRTNSEVNIGMRVGAGTDGVTASDRAGEYPITLVDGFHGLPADTNGKWQRFETTVTTPPEAKKARFYGEWYGFNNSNEVFAIADMEVTELKEKTLTPLQEGAGLTFGGTYDVEDSVVGVVRTEGPVVSFQGAWAQNIGVNEMYIDFMGDKGGIRLQYGKDFVKYGTLNGMLTETKFNFSSKNMFQNEIDAFMDCIDSGEVLASNIETVSVTAKLLDAIYRSADSHKEITF